MLTIRLFRTGRRNQPSFKIVIIDKRKGAHKGRFVEGVGFYDPLTKQRNLKGERIRYWLAIGAKPSATVYNMLVAAKIIEGVKIPKHKITQAKESTPQQTPQQQGQSVQQAQTIDKAE